MLQMVLVFALLATVTFRGFERVWLEFQSQNFVYVGIVVLTMAVIYYIWAKLFRLFQNDLDRQRARRERYVNDFLIFISPLVAEMSNHFLGLGNAPTYSPNLSNPEAFDTDIRYMALDACQLMRLYNVDLSNGVTEELIKEHYWDLQF